ncbi:MAG: zinc ABC transporter substrate-binding protein [Acidimicrobiia bacterium]|nr:zinc ABC transporter substrate-binding protein [Acidimicrobiia bacterium]
MLFSRRIAVAATVLSLLAVLAGCGEDTDGSPETTGGSESAMRLSASFYPLAWMAEEVGGEHVEVSNLTPPGAEPHDLELTPSDVAAVSDADLVVYLSGFQPAVDEAVTQADQAAVFDAAEWADLSLTYTPIEEGEEETDEAGAVDPHFWLDPARFAAVATAFAEQLSERDPKHAADFEANLASLTDRLEDVDADFKTGLADCTSENVVTSHNAFGYLADRYGMVQVGITGLTPEEEPSPADLAAVTQFVEENDVQTIYFETLVSPDIAKAVAAEAEVDTDVLDPLEGLNDESQGSDYLEVMASNLANLRRGQDCS